jgi:hypothetical protein
VGDRYDPLPGITALPALAWRRLGRAGRSAVVGLLVLATGLVVWAAPRISAGEEARTRHEARARRAAVRRERARLAADQRPHHARTPARSRAGAVAALERAITRDARARGRAGTLPPPPVRRTRCRPLAEDPRYRGGIQRLRCVGETTDVAGGRGALGFEFLGAVRPASGRLVWCKTNPAAGEKANGATLAAVPLSPACFGGRRPG